MERDNKKKFKLCGREAEDRERVKVAREEVKGVKSWGGQGRLDGGTVLADEVGHGRMDSPQRTGGVVKEGRMGGGTKGGRREGERKCVKVMLALPSNKNKQRCSHYVRSEYSGTHYVQQDRQMHCESASLVI